MGQKLKLTVEIPPETMTLLDKLTDISGTGSRGRTIQLMAETIAGCEKDVTAIMETVKRGLVLNENIFLFAVEVANITGPLSRFYPRKERKP